MEDDIRVFKVNNLRKFFLLLFIIFAVSVGLVILSIGVSRGYVEGVSRGAVLIVIIGSVLAIGGASLIKLYLKFIVNRYEIDNENISITTMKRKYIYKYADISEFMELDGKYLKLKTSDGKIYWIPRDIDNYEILRSTLFEIIASKG
jgi:hypothetical protein